MQELGKFAFIEQERPALIAQIRGSAAYPDVKGTAKLYWLSEGMYAVFELEGLPPDTVLGFHIHDGLACGAVTGAEPFAAAGKHFSVCSEDMQCGRHPYHAGDLPPLLSDESGRASSQVFTKRTDVSGVSGKPIVVHRMSDDLMTRPAGNSGVRIACGLLAENI